MLQTIDRKSSKGIAGQICEILRKHIILLSPGSQIPNEIDLCQRLGVSRMTMSKAINNLVSEGWLYRIRGKGTFVKKPIRKVKSIKILLPGPDSLDSSCRTTELFRSCVRGISYEARKLGLRLETVLCTHDHCRKSMDPEMFRSFNPNTNIFVASQWWHPLFEALLESKCNVVMCNNQKGVVKYKKHMLNWSLLTLDRIDATEKAVNYLLNLGRKRIFCFAPHDSYDGNDPRWQGYLNALKYNHIQFDPELSMEVALSAPTSFDPKLVLQTLKNAFKKKRFDALIIPNPWLINIVFEFIKELNLHVPEDLALIGIGDSREMLEAPIPISVMAEPTYALGKEVVKIFDKNTFSPGEKVFKFNLIERESTCKGAGNTENPNLQINDFKHSEKDRFFYI